MAAVRIGDLDKLVRVGDVIEAIQSVLEGIEDDSLNALAEEKVFTSLGHVEQETLGRILREVVSDRERELASAIIACVDYTM